MDFESSRAMNGGVLGRGEGQSDLWNRGQAPTQDEERALMARFGMEIV